MVPTLTKYSTFSAVPDSTAASCPHPETTAWIGSRFLLSWVDPLICLGQRKQLHVDDIWPLQRQHQADHLSPRFAHDFEATRSIPRAFFASFGAQYLLTGVTLLMSLMLSLVGPVVLNHVVSSLTSSSFDLNSVSYWIGALFASQVMQALVDKYTNFELELIAIKFVVCLKSLLYQKTMRLSAKSRMQKSTGAITNMFTSDSDSITSSAYFIHQLWSLPLQICIVSYMLYNVLDVAAFAGIGFILFMLIVNNFLSKRMASAGRVCRTSKDERMKTVVEVFKAISMVKFNAWEERLLERIDATRTKELHNILHFRLYWVAANVLMWGMPVFISMASFGVYAVVLGRELTPAIVFTSITLFQMIQGPLRSITYTITMLVQSQIALERVAEFLEMSEIDPDNVQTIRDECANSYIANNVIVAMENASFGWDDETRSLKDVDLKVQVGDFFVVHGSVGCGKSSLCSALLGEMVKHSGTVYVGGGVAYCSQQPWIQNMTVRENILFGLPYNRKKYEKVVDACALTEDLKSLPAGDHTEIGERGVNVSGGQKARIALARACYSDASVYILDSPLAAVDAIVQNELFQKCLLGLLKDKTILLVTHNPEIIASPHITHAVTINANGNLVETRQIQTRPVYDPIVSPMMAHAYAKLSYNSDHNTIDSAYANIVPKDSPNDESMVEPKKEMALMPPLTDNKLETFGVTDTATNGEKDRGKLIVEESRSEGRVGGHVFRAYYDAVGGFPAVSVFLLANVMWQVFQVASDFWVGRWASDSANSTLDNSSSTEYHLGVYSALGLCAAFMVVIRALMITIYGLKAAKSLFNRMTHSLIHAPMSFFDTNPIGRILTRYGSDVATVDGAIPLTFNTFFARLFSVGSCAITAAVIIQWKGLFLLPIVFVYTMIGAFYIRPARELQRIAMTVRAPVLNHLSESVDGGSTLRAFGPTYVTRFNSIHFDKLDNANKVEFSKLCVSQWFALRIQLLGSVLALIVTGSLVMLHDELSASVIGLAFSYALKVSQNLEGIVQVLARVETIMVSPERLQEYIDIPQEAPHRIASMDPPRQSQWPSDGAVEFDNVSFRYKDGDRLVLNDVNLKIGGGEKIGIVGRTGAGKSSLTMALFRINELASGTVCIDGVDVGQIGLKALREKLSIIPQNPVLFKGPLRGYLDPFGEFVDDDLWRCIREVGMVERISSDEKKLDCVVEENGENFSVGERQMLCMARALLCDSRIVIFDEATAAMDRATDQKLQRVIREAFAHSTVLTIAHRLDTILDADRIVVLDGGRIVEFASPAELVKKGHGHFFDLMKEGGYLETVLGSTGCESK